jgi:hypothetical protein
MSCRGASIGSWNDSDGDGEIPQITPPSDGNEPPSNERGMTTNVSEC